MLINIFHGHKQCWKDDLHQKGEDPVRRVAVRRDDGRGSRLKSVGENDEMDGIPFSCYEGCSKDHGQRMLMPNNASDERRARGEEPPRKRSTPETLQATSAQREQARGGEIKEREKVEEERGREKSCCDELRAPTQSRRCC